MRCPINVPATVYTASFFVLSTIRLCSTELIHVAEVARAPMLAKLCRDHIMQSKSNTEQEQHRASSTPTLAIAYDSLYPRFAWAEGASDPTPKRSSRGVRSFGRDGHG